MNAEQSAASRIFETYPTWIGGVLKDALAEGLEPRAVYYSWEYDSRRIPALVVLPTALVGVQIEFIGHSTALSVSRASVGLDEVVRSSVSMRSALMNGVEEAYPVQTQDVELELHRELPPFGTTIRLPLSKNDYRGDWDAQHRVARSVADALLSLSIGPRLRT